MAVDITSYWHCTIPRRLYCKLLCQKKHSIAWHKVPAIQGAIESSDIQRKVTFNLSLCRPPLPTQRTVLSTVAHSRITFLGSAITRGNIKCSVWEECLWVLQRGTRVETANWRYSFSSFKITQDGWFPFEKLDTYLRRVCRSVPIWLRWFVCTYGVRKVSLTCYYWGTHINRSD